MLPAGPECGLRSGCPCVGCSVGDDLRDGCLLVEPHGGGYTPRKVKWMVLPCKRTGCLI